MEQKEGLSEIVRGTFWVFLGLSGGYVLEYGIKILIARAFGVSIYGLISLCLTFSTVFIIVGLLGMQTGAARYMAVHQGQERGTEMRAIVWQGGAVVLSSGIVFTLIFFFSQNYIISRFFKLPFDHLLLVIFIIAVPVDVVAEYFYACIRGLKRARDAMLAKEVVRRLVTICGIGITAYVSPEPAYIGFAYLGGYIAYLISAGTMLIRGLPEKQGVVHKFKLGDMVKYSFPLVLSQSLMLLGTQGANIFLGYFHTTYDVGLYSAVASLSQAISIPLTITLFMFLPVISQYWHQGNLVELREIFLILCRWLCGISGIIFLLLVTFPERILSYTFGPEFVLASQALIIISFGQFFNNLCGPNGALLLGAKESVKYFLCDVLSIAITVTIYITLIPSLGYLGAAIANFMQLISVNVFRLILIYRIMKIHPFSKEIVKFLICLFLIMLFSILLKQYWSIYAVILISIPAYCMAIFAAKILTAADINFLVSFFTKRKQLQA